MAGRKDISPTDIDLFRQSIGPVKKIKYDTVQPVAHRQKKKTTSIPQEINPVTSASKVPAPDPVGMGDYLSYRRPGIQQRVLSRLKKGLPPIQRELDLHGQTQVEAEKILASFLVNCSNDDVRCVRIIHGKGFGSAENKPVIKNAVNSCLRNSGYVLAFCSARENDGGTGAVYVLLKNR